MHASLPKPDLANTVDADRRRVQRAARQANASIAMAGKDPCEALLTDVSLHGCCVETSADWLRPGRFVGIRLGAAPALESIVRWSRNGFAGLELLRAIPAARTDWLDLVD